MLPFTDSNRTPKAVATLRYRLLGAAQENPAWYTGAEALEFAIDRHHGMTRADGVTPYVVHPVEVAQYALTLNLQYPVESVAVALLHDVMEDCHVTHRELQAVFGAQIADGVAVMSKQVDGGPKKPLEAYFQELAQSPIGSICKAADRINNQNTMGGVFSAQKQLRQVDETERFILPMLKTARRRFPRQELAFENAKLVLRSQVALVRAMHAAPSAEE